MKRIAFFVEGLTEQLFIEKLLNEIFDQKKIAIEVKKIKGGKRIPIALTTISTPIISQTTNYYILIYDCGGDGNIRSYIMDQRAGLLKAGYSKIIGIRDVYPDFSRSDIHKLQYGLNFKLPQKDLQTKFILSIMEIESWFLADENHYPNINSVLTRDFISQNSGFDPSTYNTQLFNEPANKLNEVYNLVGDSYVKENSVITRTVESLDYANLYFEVHKRISSFKELIDEIINEIE